MSRVGVLAAAFVAVSVLLGTALTGCSDDPARSPDPASGAAPGCGLVPASRVVALVGRDLRTRSQGSTTALREQHRALSCRSAVRGHPERYLAITARYHPAPYDVADRSCSAGWVFAGTPEKYAPACQDRVDGHGRTRLVVRWQPYLMELTVGRSGADWAGDPERGLALSRSLAARLGVDEASPR